ncbi:uncharacterized protein PGTG_05350 [Puccinia graminis f. sp. tritici CRL 75-36-700-3]|uniref:Uncharacterized protein n=1 Tax=Puccinia graminis f. sp. tritici (strain CRL 75-36-700-3 / race SCCL) TaxID=418459 RepID=E3K772_PUCGT|nr:uncharacterized protein PGTG_05350 [Puccinia graminis f. sp. tritici CRL 75-36-700-3]EFP80125.2 hypothetical protein PGTG_05350 [Puccinia graminis f. sp. tritici CRL 75-36-700-3]
MFFPPTAWRAPKTPTDPCPLLDGPRGTGSSSDDPDRPPTPWSTPQPTRSKRGPRAPARPQKRPRAPAKLLKRPRAPARPQKRSKKPQSPIKAPGTQQSAPGR